MHCPRPRLFFQSGLRRGRGDRHHRLRQGEEATQAIATAVPEALPRVFALRAMPPNPFATGTLIEFDVPIAEPVTLCVFSVAGRQVRVLATGPRGAGSRRILWNA